METNKSVPILLHVFCHHCQQPVPIAGQTIYASSYQHNRMRLFRPDLIVALASSWLGDTCTILTYGVKEKPPGGFIPTIYVDWADQGGIDPIELRWLVKTILKRLAFKQRIEIGCIGGHGRTGTLLACLVGKAENLPPKQAIMAVKERYCKEAVESSMQTTLIYKFLSSTEAQAKEDWPVQTKDWSKILESCGYYGYGVD